MWSFAKAAWKMVVMEGASAVVAGWRVNGMVDVIRGVWDFERGARFDGDGLEGQWNGMEWNWPLLVSREKSSFGLYLPYM